MEQLERSNGAPTEQAASQHTKRTLLSCVSRARHEQRGETRLIEELLVELCASEMRDIGREGALHKRRHKELGVVGRRRYGRRRRGRCCDTLGGRAVEDRVEDQQETRVLGLADVTGLLLAVVVEENCSSEFWLRWIRGAERIGERADSVRTIELFSNRCFEIGTQTDCHFLQIDNTTALSIKRLKERNHVCPMVSSSVPASGESKAARTLQ